MSRTRRIAAGWFAAGLWCATVCPAVRVDIRLEPASSGTPSASAEGVVRAVALDPASPREARLQVEAAATIPGGVALDLEAGRSWRIELQSENYWSPERVFIPGADRRAVLAMWVVPTGSLRGSVEPPAHEKAPAQLEIRFQSSPGGAPGTNVPRSVRSCPIEGGQWRCSLPAGTLDVRLASPGIIPVYRWEVAVPSGRSVDFGAVKLVRGSSIAGRVEVADGAPVHKLCQVKLTPNFAGRPVESEQRSELLAPAVGVDERGFFHFDGVKPGSYRLTARQAGFAPASIPTLIVGADQETELEQPLVLRPLLKLAVNVDPPLDPWEQPWHASLHLLPGGGSGAIQDAAQGVFTSAGSYRAEGLEQGTYILDVADSRGTGFLSERVDLDSDKTLDRTLDLVWVEGTARLGDAALETGLRFTSAGNRGAIVLKSNAKGRFEGVLPHTGRWRVELTAIHRTIYAVPVERLPGTRRAKVAIEVPDTKLSGETVDEKGQALSASISVISVDEGILDNAASDGAGAFELGGLAYATYSVQAEAEREGSELSSDAVTVGLSKSHATEFVRLTLHAQIAISGQVRSGSQPVAGASVFAAPKGPPGMPPLSTGGSYVITGADGGFRLTVPAAASEVVLLVSPPGFALRSLRLTAPFPAPVAVEVAPRGGTLILTAATPLESSLALDQGPGARLPLVLQDGNPIVFRQLLAWGIANGQPRRDAVSRVVTPNVAAGEYTACMLTFAEQMQVMLGLAAVDGRACEHGYLAAGGELTLGLRDGR